MAGLDSSTFERDFELARETLPCRLMKASEQHRPRLARALVQGQEVIPYSVDIWTVSLVSTW